MIIFYSESAKLNSKLFKAKPMKAMDTALFWIEYVAQYGNVLRSPALELTWWQLNLIDVYGFLFFCVSAFSTVIFIFFYYVTKFMIKKLIC